MSAIDHFCAELAAICSSLEDSERPTDTPEYVDLCNRLWSLVYRPFSGTEKNEIVQALQEAHAPLAARSRCLAQRIEKELELRWADDLLARDVPLSVNFLLSNKSDVTAQRHAFESLLHGYPMAWALPRYTAELDLLRAVSGRDGVKRVAVVGSSAVPFTAVYFQTLGCIKVTYLDPDPRSAALGKRFVSRLEALGILAPGSVVIEELGPTLRLSSELPGEAVFIVDQATPHHHWFSELSRAGAALVFCQDAVGLASIVYQPIVMSELPAQYILAGQTVPAHSALEPRRDICQVPIQSPDVFLTTAAFRATLQ